MDALSPILIAKALDGLSMRYMATAENIANANSPHYRPVRVTFEDQLRSAAAGGPDAIARVMPRIEEAPTPAIASEMRLDLEIATASQTAMRYAALIDVLGKQGALRRAAIGGGE